MPEAVFARAIASATAGDYEAAVKTYKTLIQNDRADLRRAALYNLGNLHMRAGFEERCRAACRDRCR